MKTPMKLTPVVVATTMLAASMLAGGQQSEAPKAAFHGGSEADRAAIERLHEVDMEATLSDKADQLAKLWDKDAVRLSVGRPAEIGAAVIYAHDKGWETSSGRERTLCFDLEIQDIQIAGDWAFEWGYGSLKTSKGDKVSIDYGKGMRVMKRQSDGTWRFARVLFVRDTSTGVLLTHPCQ